MMKFISFISLDERVKSGDNYGNNEKGVFHELLTGHYLLDKKRHLSDPKGRPGETSKQAHDRLHALAMKHGGRRAIDDAHTKAKAAAADIKKQLKGHKIKDVHWTSKTGDVERVTGTKATQKQDASDIYVTTHHPQHGKQFYGVSLKASDKTLKVPASSLGQQSSGRKTVNLGRGHRDSILNKYPALRDIRNKEARKDWAEKNPKAHADIRTMNQGALNNVAKMHTRELKARHRLAQRAGGEKHMDILINHIRDVMAAKKTPGELAGTSNFFKHTTYQTKGGDVKHHTSIPGKDHEHIFDAIRKDPKSLSITYTKGGTINFHHNGKRFASQSHKFDTQSDPLSTLKTAGRLA